MTPKVVRVGDVLELERAPVAVDLADTYTPIGIRSFGRGIFHYDRTDGASLSKLRFFEIRPGRLVVSNIKGWEGAIATSTERDTGCIGSNRFLSYTADPAIADVNYLKHYFLSEAGLPLIQRASPGSADRNRTLAIDRFEAITIPLPDITEQRRVAAMLDAIASQVRAITDCAATATALFNALRSSVAARPDLDETARRKRGWVRVRVGEIASLWTAEEPVDPMSTYRIAGVYSFGRGLLDRGAIDGSATSYKKIGRLREGNIVMSRLKAWEGALALVSSEFDGRYVSPEFPQFEIDRSRALAEFLGFAISSPLFWESLAGGSKGIGARRERVSAARLLAHEIWIPPLTHQRQVVVQLEQLEQAAHLRERTATLTAALEVSALNQAFAGQV